MPMIMPIAGTAAGTPTVRLFPPSATAHSLLIPEGTTRIRAALWGAAGLTETHFGPVGGYVEGDIQVIPGETLYIVVGRSAHVHGADGLTPSAWGAHQNGGEFSGIFENAPPDMTDAATRSVAHANAVMIAGGAGAPAWSGGGGGSLGYGGGETGGDGQGQAGSAGPGTQTAGGSSGPGGTDGDKLIGGYNSTGSAGGGSGYYGGGAVYYTTGGLNSAGGGSGYLGNGRVSAGLFEFGEFPAPNVTCGFWLPGVASGGLAAKVPPAFFGCGLCVVLFKSY